MQAIRRVLLLASAFAGAPCVLFSQAGPATLDSGLAAWLAEQPGQRDSAWIVDTAQAGGSTIALVRVWVGPYESEHWTLLRPLANPDSVVLLGKIESRWSELAIAAAFADEVYVLKHGSYGMPFLQHYDFDDGEVDTFDRRLPQPGPVVIIGDSIYAAWSDYGGVSVGIAVAIETGGFTAFAFAPRQVIEQIDRRSEGVIFLSREAGFVRRRAGEWLTLEHDDAQPRPTSGRRLLLDGLPGFWIVPDGLEHVTAAGSRVIPLDFPDLAQLRRDRPDYFADGRTPDYLTTRIGPATLDRQRVWFGLTFYEGEGGAGIGGLGWLDPQTGKAELIYPSPMADYSVSAIGAYDGAVFVGLARYSEGFGGGAGIARYDPDDSSVERFDESSEVARFAFHAGRLYATTYRGLLEIDLASRATRRWTVYPPRDSGGVPPVQVDDRR